MPREARQARSAVALIATRYELIRELHSDGDSLYWEAFDSALDRPVLLQLLRPELAHDPAATTRFEAYRRAAARGPARAGDRILDGGADPESRQLFIVREWPARAWAPRRDRGVLRWLDLDDMPRWLLVAVTAVSLLVLGAALKPAVEGWLGWINQPATAADPAVSLARAAVVPAPTGAATAAPASAGPATPAPPTVAPTATPVGEPRKIVNTGGRGVALHAAPGGDRLPAKGYDEGATVQAFESSGEWTRIRGSDGREGWVLSATLAPAR